MFENQNDSALNEEDLGHEIFIGPHPSFFNSTLDTIKSI